MPASGAFRLASAGAFVSFLVKNSGVGDGFEALPGLPLGAFLVTTEKARSSTALADSLPRLEVALRDLGFAVKSLQLYPPTSPVVKDAVERSFRSFAPLLGRGNLGLEITPRFIRVDGHDIGVGAPVVEQLTNRMHGRGIGKIHLDGRLERASLQALAEIVATEQHAIDELGGIEKLFERVQPLGVQAEFLDLDRLFAPGEEAREEANVWEAILNDYNSANLEDAGVNWEELAQSVDRLGDFVGWLASNLDAVSERTGYENINVLRFVLDRLGSISSALTSDHVSLLVLAVRQAFDQFDPDVLVDLLADPMKIDAGDEDEGRGAGLSIDDFISGTSTEPTERKTIDISTYIASALEPEQAEKPILHTLRSGQPSTPRLYGLFERLTRDRPERDEMAQHIEEALGNEAKRGADQSRLIDNWPRLYDVLNGEAPQRFLSSEYETGLQQLLAPADMDSAWPIERIRPRLSEMAPSFIGPA